MRAKLRVLSNASHVVGRAVYVSGALDYAAAATFLRLIARLRSAHSFTESPLFTWPLLHFEGHAIPYDSSRSSRQPYLNAVGVVNK